MGKNKHRKSLAARRSSSKTQQQELSNIITVAGADALRRETERLQKSGYFTAPIPEGSRAAIGNGFPLLQWEDFIRSKMMCQESGSQSASKNSYPTIHLSSGGEVPCETCGTKGLGYMAWGGNNRKPNVMALLREASPYTASAHKFNVDLCAGKGPRALYHYVQYVGGNITEKSIPYSAAGTLIKGWIRDLHRELMRFGDDAEDDYIYDIREQITTLQQDYNIWEQTNLELNNFYSRNNLHLLYLSLAGNMIADGLCFPLITLNKRTMQRVEHEDGSVQWRNLPTSMWTPKITGIRYLENTEARLERMDNNGRINYVYNSKQWLNSTDLIANKGEDFKIVALPALDPYAPLTDLQRIVRETRKENGSIRKRPTQLVLPIRYPSPGHPYYPILPWQSIFSGDIYEYLMTMISDRNKRRRNSNVIGRILYINNEWLNRLYYQEKADSIEDKKKVFATLREQINSFLEDRDNMGKPLVAYTFQSNVDGKTYESWKIVEIEANDKNSVEANQKELAEISSIVFFAHGLDSRLVGNSPGDVSSSGGTDLRERYLLKQIQMSPTQMLLLAPLYLIKFYNGWDANHLEWEIPREVLTTLDSSKTGVATQPSLPEE